MKEKGRKRGVKEKGGYRQKDRGREKRGELGRAGESRAKKATYLWESVFVTHVHTLTKQSAWKKPGPLWPYYPWMGIQGDRESLSLSFMCIWLMYFKVIWRRISKSQPKAPSAALTFIYRRDTYQKEKNKEQTYKGVQCWCGCIFSMINKHRYLGKLTQKPDII